MMKPRDAYERIIKDGPFDDQTSGGVTVRWYWLNGVLACAAWRCEPTSWTHYKQPSN
jgi:hypothetical protein